MSNPSTPLRQGDCVIISSRLIGRNKVAVGTVVRTGTRLCVGDLSLYDDEWGPNTLIRVVAHFGPGR